MSEKRTIQVAFVNQPGEGKVFGSIATSDRKRFLAKPEILNQMVRGKSYVCSISSKTYDNGTVWYINQVDATSSQQVSQGPSGDDPTAKNIFVTGIVGRAMGSGKFAAVDIPLLTIEALGAFDLLSGKSKTARSPDPFNDEPFDEDPTPF